MKLIFLHGRPAVGKLTVAKELSRITGYRLFHNHLTVDLALSVYDFGTPGFIALREQIWFAVFRRAMADRLPGLIFTFNTENSVPQRFIDELFAEIAASGGEVLIIELCASEAEIERRLDLPSRHEARKLTDLALYRTLRARGIFNSPVIPPARLRIDTRSVQPADAAAQIAGLI